MALPSNLYIPLQGLETAFLDKTTGDLLSAGYLEFYSDVARSVPKDVFQQVQLPDNTYEFVNIGSIITLNSIGVTVSPNDGTNIQVYLYPYDDAGEIELYFIRVYSSDNVLQFTREAQPPNVQSSQNVDNFEGSDNQISNPQFAVTFLPDSLTQVYNVSGAAFETPIAPDWSLITDGTGDVTVTQLPLSDISMPTGAPFALEISSTGITGLKLRQTISESPRLFGNGEVSAFVYGSLVAKSNTASNVQITMDYVASNGYTVNLITDTATGDYATLANDTASEINSTNSNTPLTPGYVNIDITIPALADVSITSVQVVSVENANSNTAWVQQSVPRQIDHLYHDAYPIVPIGAIIDFAGYAVPAHYLLCDGAAIIRLTYPQLFRALNPTETVSLTNAVATFTVVSAAKYYIGMSIEGTGIAAATTISNIVGTTITMSNAATATTSSLVTFFPWGNGDGSTTFNIPNLVDYVTAGANGTLFAAGTRATGYKGGSSTHTITTGELPSHTHPAAQGSFAEVIGAGGTFAGAVGASLTTDANTGATGGGTAMTIVQPTALVYKYIRYE